MSGTYVIRAGLVQRNTGPSIAWVDNAGVSTNLVSDTWDVDVGGTALHKDSANFSGPDAPGQYILRFSGDTSAIYVDGTPTSFAGLAAGFTPTSARVEATFIFNSNFSPYIDNFHNGNSAYLSFDPLSESGDLIGSQGSPVSVFYNFPGANIPSILNLLNNGFGVRVQCGLSSVVRVGALEITGSYGIQAYTWYFNPTTNHYQYLSSNPGAPWIAQAPTLSVLTINPPQGPTTFPSSIPSETVTVTGTGFSDGVGITLSGVPLTNLNVVNQNTLTGSVNNYAGALTGPGIVVIDGEDPTHSGLNVNANTNVGNVVATNPDATTATLSNAWTYYQMLLTWWQTVALPFIFFSYYGTPPGVTTLPAGPLPPFTFPFDFFYNGVFYKRKTKFIWTVLSVPPANPGWWLSINNDFNGAALIVAQTSPHNPRSFDEMNTFATGSSGMRGGFPGPACIWNNKLVYAEGGYGAGLNSPPIDIFDGAFNHTITLVPNTAAGVVPQCIVTMLSANNVVYFTTLDNGGSGTYSGRIFSLNITTGQVTQLGVTADIATGDVPYALAWFMGRLWLGTNRGDASAGHVYWIRPGIDTNWTLDLSLSTKSLGGVDSMAQYNGNLYVGTNATSGTFAQVLKRDTSGNWTTSDTASGGTATTNNGYLAMATFGTNLYASYWNNDSPVKSIIRQFNGSTWSTVYTGSGDTLVPLIGFPQDAGTTPTLLAIGGGLTYPGAVVSTTNGTVWTDNTVFLTQISPATTALPVFGVVIR